MLDRTDRHFRFFFRQISRRARLYTEMVVDRALLRGDPERLLFHRPEERPLALQIASRDPKEAARAAGLALPHGFDEINLNVGCPSEKSQRMGIGAVLLREPDRVAAIAEAVHAETGVWISVKHRLGLEEDDEETALFRFVERVAKAGVRVFLVHARKARLDLSTRKNRAVPPLRHDLVHRLKAAFPELTVVTNGGIQDLEAVRRHLEGVDGAMVGRAAYEDPWRFAGVDAELFGEAHRPDRCRVVRTMAGYLEAELQRGTPGRAVVRPLVPLFRGVPGARDWRRALTEGPPTPATLLGALALVECPK